MAYYTYATAYPQLKVTQAFGNPNKDGPHRGIDYSTPGHADRNARSVINGTVIRSEWGTGRNSSYGNFVCIKDDASDYTAIMAHFAERYVTVGQHVNKGDVIGLYGDTGRADGYHVHLERNKGTGITNVLEDPSVWLGVPNVPGIYDVIYGGTGDVPDPPVDPSQPIKPPKPPEVASTMANMLIVVFTYEGHVINAPASNDEEGYVYFNTSNFYRTKYDNIELIEQYTNGYWNTISNVNIIKIYNKDLTSLPDV